MKNRGRTLTGDPPRVWFFWDMFFSGKMDLYEREVFMYLKAHCRKDTWQAWPSYGSLATEIGISRYQVIKSVKSLEHKGIITVERRKNDKGEHTSNLYTINDTLWMWREETADESDARIHTSAQADIRNASDDELLATMRRLQAEMDRRGLLPETEKTESSTENPENIIYMEKAPALSTDQSESTDTNHKTTASTEEGTAVFFDNDSTEPVENASINVSKDHPNETEHLIDTIAHTVDHAAPGLLTHKDCRAAAKELIKFNPNADADHLCSLASELTTRMDKAYHAGKVKKPIAYLITAIQRERSRDHAKGHGISGGSSVPMGGDLTHEHKSTGTMKAYLDSLKDDGGGGNGG